MARKNKKGKGEQKPLPKDDADNGEDEWEIVAWINPTKKGKVLTLSYPKDEDGEGGDLIGFIRVDSMEKLLDDDIGGVPVKIRRDDD